MKVNAFKKEKACPKLAHFSSYLGCESRYTVLAKEVKLLLSGQGSLDAVEGSLLKAYRELNLPFSWQPSLYAKDDAGKIARLYYNYLSKLKIVAVLVEGMVTLPEASGGTTLTATAHLVARDGEGKFHAIVIHPGKAAKSLKGRSAATTASLDLEPLVVKYGLEERYPGVEVDLVYLTNSKDSEGNTVEEFIAGTSAGSNLHRCQYADLYKDGVFDYEGCFALICAAASYSQSHNCMMCDYDVLCRLEEKNICPVCTCEGEESPKSPVPFTDAQLQVVRHLDGPMRVCAGPGSGKTATLVGRVRYLVEECHVAPEFILVVTFTNEAAEELRSRCAAFLNEASLPTVATLNGFSYRILLANQEGDVPMKVLTEREQNRLIKLLLSVRIKPLQGFNSSVEKGKNGLLACVKRALLDYNVMDRSSFFSKYRYIDETEWCEFSTQFFDIVREGGYITFDEQISKSVELLKARPEVLATYNSIYKYVMVDEFQDINSEQMELIRLLTPHENIVVVGDDDQNLYSFRGADVRYLLEFDRYYKNVRNVVLKDNFRSTKEIVECANALIQNNRSRISKDIRSSSGRSGPLPVLVRDTSTDTVTKHLKEVLSCGYSPDDVAVLAFTNKRLEDLYDSFVSEGVPCVLSKSYLRFDRFFLFLYSVLKICATGCTDNKAFYTFVCLFGKQKYLKKGDGSLYNAAKARAEQGEDLLAYELMLIDTFLSVISAGTEIGTLLQMAEYYFDSKESNAPEVIRDLVDKEALDAGDVAGFLELLDQISFEDSTRVEVRGEGQVSLITSHDSKGKEFKVVLFVNDLLSSDESESSRRLYYVSLTRAKEKVVIFEDASSKVSLIGELPHEELFN